MEFCNIDSYLKNISNKKGSFKCLTSNEHINFKDFLIICQNLAENIKNLGVKENDIVFFCRKNSLDYLKFFFASLLGNFIFFPIDYTSKKYFIEKLKKQFVPKLIIDDQFDISLLLKKKNIKITHSLNNNCLIVLTSGTTGDPKGILFKKSSLFKSAKYFSNLVKYDEKSRVYHILPMHYMAGLLNTFLSPLLSGSTIIVGDGLNSLSLLHFWNTILENNINSLHITPTIASALVRLNKDKVFNKNDITLFREIISTGSFLDKNLIDNFENNFGIRLRSCYGITEAGGPLTCQNWDDTYELQNVGIYLKEINFKTEKVNAEDVKESLFVKTNFMMEGYVNSNNDIANSKFDLELDEEGFFNTKDYAILKENKVFLEGRRKDIIKIGDEIISLRHIENEIKKIDIIEDAACTDQEDSMLGRKIVCFCKFISNENTLEQINQLNIFLNDKLKKKELPGKIIPVNEIPKNQAGKVQKHILKSIYL